MTKTKEKKTYNSPFKKDINGFWCTQTVFLKPDGRYFFMACSGSGAKAPAAKKDALARLESYAAEYLAENPGTIRLSWEEYAEREGN